nr:LytTR family DNA-binding domain-containing protein [uncultured Brevundimonas sp.]
MKTPRNDRNPILLRGVIVALIAALLMTATGAFGTGAAPLLKRLAYWTFALLVGGFWGHICGLLVSRFVDADERPWLAVACLSLVITGPLSVLIWAATGPFFGHPPYPLKVLPYLVGPVAVITVVVTAANVFLGRAQPPQTHAAAPDALRPPRFLDRLPLKLRGARILAVQAEDHYLRIHTDRGSDLILMRLSDALEELEGLEGAQTHRSWWVAKDAVRGVERGDGRATLTLEGGLSAPVSRRHARALREADWW